MKYIMKKILIALLLLSCTMGIQAQVERNIIYRCARGAMTYTEPVEKKESTSKSVGKIIGTALLASAGVANDRTDHPEYANAVMDAIAGSIGSARRIRVVDGQFEPGEVAEGDAALYCNANISAITSSARTKVWEDDKKKKHESTEYRGNITGTINIKDAHTDQVVFTYTINTSSYALEWFDDQAKALGYAINGMKANLRQSLNNAFPLYASIAEGARATKSKEKEVYIDLGEQLGCVAGMHFNVYTVKTIAGKEAKKQIGQLKVTEVMGDDISLCKVQRGGAEIKTAIEAGETLLITSKD